MKKFVDNTEQKRKNFPLYTSSTGMRRQALPLLRTCRHSSRATLARSIHFCRSRIFLSSRVAKYFLSLRSTRESFITWTVQVVWQFLPLVEIVDNLFDPWARAKQIVRPPGIERHTFSTRWGYFCSAFASKNISHRLRSLKNCPPDSFLVGHIFTSFKSVRPPGIEPGTFSLKGSCSTGWAMGGCVQFVPFLNKGRECGACSTRTELSYGRIFYYTLFFENLLLKRVRNGMGPIPQEVVDILLKISYNLNCTCKVMLYRLSYGRMCSIRSFP